MVYLALEVTYRNVHNGQQEDSFAIRTFTNWTIVLVA